MVERKTISILGCGWLGMPLGAALVQNRLSVKGSSRSASKQEEIAAKGMMPFQLDLEQYDDLPNDFFDTDIIIFNIPPSNAASEQSYSDQLDRFLAHVRKDTQVLFVSSTGVYPNSNRIMSEEDASYGATSRSGVSLLKAEEKFWSSKNTVVRFGGLIDERRHPGRWFAGKTNLKGGNVPVNMIHRDDCIGAIQTIIEKQLWGQVFNVCYPDHPTKREYYPRMSALLGLEPPTFMAEDDSSWKTVSPEKFLTKSNYEFRRSIWEV